MKSQLLALVLLATGPIAVTADELAVDLSGMKPECGVEVRHEGDRLIVEWPVGGGDSGRLGLRLRDGEPLIEWLGLVRGGDRVALLQDVDPVTFLTVGTRAAPAGRPPDMSPFNVFFDSPAQRPHQSHRSILRLKRARASSQGRRATVALGDLAIGPFAGEWQFTVYPGGRLVHVEAVVKTDEPSRAILYDSGLVAAAPGWKGLAWMDTEGRLQSEPLPPEAPDRPIAVRHRTIIAEVEGGAVACFPPPHQYFFPRDLTDNLKYVWSGRGHRGLENRSGFGIRQDERGGGAFVPWCNAPPGTEQRLGVFYLLSRGSAPTALQETLRYTRGDRFAKLPGHYALTSHWHLAVAVAALKAKAEGRPPSSPDFVRMFKEMGVDIVHLAEFHGDGHPRDPGPLRLPELEAMFSECRRLSDADILFLPGEEANVHLGLNEPGKHPGHWMYLFPRPVYWIMQRGPDQPFAEEHPRYGTLYRVGNRAEMLQLLERERGLAWTAHPRIKASSWAPDIYRREDFYLSDRWLGAAWKAMPADLSDPRLGRRVLDLLDDMANWGQEKYVLGEVDVFKLDHTHDLFGHMNINYIRLDRRPNFDDGWGPILDALRGGRFFVTTGEMLLREFTVGGKASGQTLARSGDMTPEVQISLEWTFPPRFVELISGDGTRVDRQRIDLTDAEPFGRSDLKFEPRMEGKRWVRVEAWDVAGNGAFSQPVWLER